VVANGNNMVSSLGWYTPAQARQEMAAARDMFNRLVADGRLGQREEQGGNYYLDDPVERMPPQMRLAIGGCWWRLVEMAWRSSYCKGLT
jgi:hypothetical protein